MVEEQRPEPKNAEEKNLTKQGSPKAKKNQNKNAKTTLEDDDNTPSITPAPSVPANDKKTRRPIPKSNNRVSKVNNTPKDKSKATQPRGRRKQNSSTAPATDETTEHPTRPSRSSILRQRRRSKTSEGAATSESKNALDALAENIAKLTTQKSQQDNHPTYTQADVENFLKKSDNEVTIKVRGGDVTINGNPLENTEI